MDLLVYSRGAIERLPPHEVSHVIISITTTSDDVARVPIGERCREVLRLSFLDADVLPPDGSGRLFGVDDAQAILSLLDRQREHVERIVLHCDAGLSRSPAVAAALAVCLGQSDQPFFRRYRPNMRVYRTLLDEHQRRLDANGRT